MLDKDFIIMTSTAAVFVSIFAYLLFGGPDQAITLGVMHSAQELEARSENYEFPPVVYKVDDDGTMWTRHAPSFNGRAMLLLGDNVLEFPNARVSYWSSQGYIESINVLERRGRYTREEAARKYIEYARMVEAMPVVEEVSGGLGDRTDEELYDSMMVSLGRFHPKGIYGSRKLTLLSSEVVFVKNGKAFAHSLSLNMTYDERRPKTPYGFGFRVGTMAGSNRCLRNLDYHFHFGPGRRGISDDPVLLEHLKDWSREDISDEVLRPLIDEYVFEKCTMDDVPVLGAN